MCAVRFKNSSLQNWRKRVFGRERDDFQFCEESTYVDLCLCICLCMYVCIYLPTYYFTYLSIEKERKMESSRDDKVEILKSPVYNVYVHSFIHSFVH